MTVALLHAYRAANRGDGWLVELSQQLIRDATGADPITYALDPDGLGPRARPVFRGPDRLWGLAAPLSALGSSAGPMRSLGRLVTTLPDPGELSAAIGIGGGYLRSNDPVHELVFRAHHLPQLRLAAALGPRAAYLPVSVGPFRRGLGRTVRRQLGAVGWVATRDDRSDRYLTGWANGWRVPDLAACRIGVDRPGLDPGSDEVVAVAFRSLAHSNLGSAAVSLLEERGYKVRVGLQSSAGRTNDDRSLYQAAGLIDRAEDFGALLRSGPRPAVVVAGRLHAALEAIAAGYPTIHLGYERKSLGAFTDLGLAGYVIDAWTGQPGPLAELVSDLAGNPERYWSSLSERFDTLALAWDRLGQQIQRVVGR